MTSLFCRRWLILPAILLTGLAMTDAPRPDGGDQVAIDGFAFAPASIAIGRGREVTWTNHDAVAHSVVFGAPGGASSSIAKGKIFSRRFDSAGTFAYVCGVHPYMHGQVTVQ